MKLTLDLLAACGGSRPCFYRHVSSAVRRQHSSSGRLSAIDRILWIGHAHRAKLIVRRQRRSLPPAFQCLTRFTRRRSFLSTSSASVNSVEIWGQTGFSKRMFGSVCVPGEPKETPCLRRMSGKTRDLRGGAAWHRPHSPKPRRHVGQPCAKGAVSCRGGSRSGSARKRRQEIFDSREAEHFPAPAFWRATHPPHWSPGPCSIYGRNNDGSYDGDGSLRAWSRFYPEPKK